MFKSISGQMINDPDNNTENTFGLYDVFVFRKNDLRHEVRQLMALSAEDAMELAEKRWNVIAKAASRALDGIVYMKDGECVYYG